MYCIVLQPQIFRWSHLLFPYWRFEYSVPSCQCVAPRVLIRYRYRQYYSTHWLRLQTPIYPVLILITICFQSIFWKSNLLWCQCGKWIFFSVKNQLKPFFCWYSNRKITPFKDNTTFIYIENDILCFGLLIFTKCLLSVHLPSL